MCVSACVEYLIHWGPAGRRRTLMRITLTSEEKEREQETEGRFSCNQDIRGDGERASGRSCEWRERESVCVRGDNGEEQVREVVLFRPRVSEILQKQWSGKRHCVCHITRISASGDQESIAPLSIAISFEILYKIDRWGVCKANITPSVFHGFRENKTW